MSEERELLYLLLDNGRASLDHNTNLYQPFPPPLVLGPFSRVDTDMARTVYVTLTPEEMENWQANPDYLEGDFQIQTVQNYLYYDGKYYGFWAVLPASEVAHYNYKPVPFNPVLTELPPNTVIDPVWQAALKVIQTWDHGDLAGAVGQLREALGYEPNPSYN